MRLMLAFNRNMLALFLIANLLTGAVNLSVNTLAVGSWAARIIVGECIANPSSSRRRRLVTLCVPAWPLSCVYACKALSMGRKQQRL
jgi:hypothetical protein